MIASEDEKLRIEEVLEYYDMPLLASCRDKEGRLHLALAVEDVGDEKTIFLTAVIDDQILADVCGAKIPLREVYEKPLGDLYVLTCYHPGREELEPYKGALPVPDEWLPDRGAFLDRC